MSLIRLVFISLLCIVSLATSAAETKAELSIELISSELELMEAGVANKKVLLKNIDAYLSKLPAYAAWTKACIDRTAKEVQTLQEQLGKLGGTVLSESADSKAIRNELLDKKSRASDELSRCKALLVHDESLTTDISVFRKQNLEEQSFVRGKHIFAAFSESITESHGWILDLAQIVVSKQGMKALAGSEKLMLLSLISLAIIFGMMIRKRLYRWQGNALERWQKTQLSQAYTGMRMLAALAMTVRRYVIPMLIALFVTSFIHFETLNQVPKPLLTIITDSLPVLVGIYALTYFVYFALRELGLRPDLDIILARTLRKRLNLLATIWFVGYLLTQTIIVNSLSEASLFTARALLGIILVGNVIWVIWQTRKSERLRFNQTVRIVSTLILIAALIAEFTGYRNLSGFALRGVVGTLVAYGLFQLVSDLLSRMLSDLDEGKSLWQKRFRKSIGVNENDSFPGFIWLKLVSSIVVWIGLIGALLHIWNVPRADIQVLISKVTLGFSIGSIDIVPSKIFEAVVVLVLLLTLNGWFQKVLEKTWLTAARIDRGARESISAISNYLGIGFAVIIALSVAGMDFSKLAIIAGALSVGIGFGLQNIVNNFVSGLILLFERPIKTGDWIVANGVEGIVKKISIRSTEIQSFDRADIIVPNSLLISDNLTNWVHKDLHGRLRMPVSVAYGTNTKLVKELLLALAQSHKAVIVGQAGMHDPKVMFLEFGDSSLNFELRFFVRDIFSRLDILSEINFAIDQAFRENNIEIPFPQRVVHVRDSAVEDYKTDAGENVKIDLPDKSL